MGELTCEQGVASTISDSTCASGLQVHRARLIVVTAKGMVKKPRDASPPTISFALDFVPRGRAAVADFVTVLQEQVSASINLYIDHLPPTKYKPQEIGMKQAPKIEFPGPTPSCVNNDRACPVVSLPKQSKYAHEYFTHEKREGCTKQ